MKIHALAAVSLIAAGTLSVAAQQPSPIPVSSPLATARATVLRSSAAKLRTDSFTTIQGNALNSTNGAMPDVIVRLRDARYGRIVDTQLTDQSGLFSFKAIDPGTYIVEVMATNNDTVLAASQLLNVNAGEAVSAVVKLPFRIPPFAGVMGSGTTPSAAIVATQAAATGITAMVPTIPISPTQ
jgi:hypothetical protein